MNDRLAAIGRPLIMVSAGTLVWTLARLALPSSWSVSQLAVQGLHNAVERPFVLFIFPLVAVFTSTLILALVPLRRLHNTGHRKGSELLFLGSITLLVVLMRWPLLALHEQSPDESIEIAAASVLAAVTGRHRNRRRCRR